MNSSDDPSSGGAPGLLVFVCRLWGYIRPYRSQSLAISVLLLLESTFGALVPLSLKFVIDEALVERNRNSLLKTIIFLAVAGVTISAAGLGRDYLLTRMQARVLSDIRSRMFEHLQRLSLGFYKRTEAGEVLSRFSTDLASVENAMTTAVPWGILPGLDCLISTALLIALDWRLAAIALCIWPWCMIVPKSFVPRVSQASYRRKTQDAEILSTVQENLSAQPVVKAFVLEGNAIAGFLKRNTELQRSSVRVGFLSALLERSAAAGIVVLQVLTIGAGAYMAYRGSLTIGTLASFQALFLALSYSLLYFTQYLPSVVPAAAGMGRIDELLGEPLEVADAAQAVELPRLSTAIDYRDVRFSFSDSRPILQGVSLSIPQGASAAFVGASGSGKSTMLSLLLRFYDPASGEITIDGHDLRQVTQSSLRRQMGVVFQESFLFNTSLMENIRLGRPDATDDEAIAAARAAEIHEFISSLPDGYRTQVGERGGLLSGGQRQRVAIARALVRHPAILILDEATSALDAATERALNDTIARAARGRTLISVTHRLASALDASVIFVFDKGRLVEQGTHAELLAADKAYAQLWNKQAGFTVAQDGASVRIDAQRLRTLPILAGLDYGLLHELEPHFVTEQFPEGRIIVHEGDPGARFYIIVRGVVQVLKTDPKTQRPHPVGVLQDGDYFGEIALLMNSPRTATVEATKPCLCVSLSRQTFMTILDKHPEMRRQITEMAQARYTQRG